MERIKKYLFIEAHLDDVALMAGGMIARLVESGNHVQVLTLSYIYEGIDLLHEWQDAMNTLNVIQYDKLSFKARHFHEQANDILQVLFTYAGQFDGYVIPSVHSLHSDHSVTAKQCIRAFKHGEIVSYCESWNHRTITKNFFVKLEHRHVQKKIEALACYKSQLNRPYFNQDMIVSEMHVNGLMCNHTYAEAFKVINILM